MKNNNHTFEKIVQKLIDYWRDLGCVTRFPYNEKVGAGTMNPETVLRVLGPEPWNVVYVEPSVRPDDGRYGENPNRLQMHHQLQVILQPDPGNPQELYLKSLFAIGIDLKNNDIRFVEDNWESPALGAWGLGWEVWLNGQEITQFTYFQQAGSLRLDPVAVELTYGLDRIVAAVQNKNSVFDIQYSNRLSYRELFLAGERQHTTYYSDVADTSVLRSLYETFESEAKHCIAKGLTLAAHDYNLKCSHTFNILDTRGAIGVTERSTYFKRMRSIARQISELYVQHREDAGFPLLQDNWEITNTNKLDRKKTTTTSRIPTMGSQDFVLEIGHEELPPSDCQSISQQLKNIFPDLLKEHRLTYQSFDVCGTPRRTTIMVKQMAAKQENTISTVKGPRVSQAYDSTGQPTAAAKGFAHAHGVSIEALLETEDGHLQINLEKNGRLTEEVLVSILPEVLNRIRFGKSMRWNASNVAFSRPLRWYVSLFGENIIPFEFAEIVSDRYSQGLRSMSGSNLIYIQSAAEYLHQIQNAGVILSNDKRKEVISIALKELEKKHFCSIPIDPDLLDEVANLIESPTIIRGAFDERFLALPPEVLVAVMRKHQRYFPVYRLDGTIDNFFVTVGNGVEHCIDNVRKGNEQVVHARFSDAEFFYNNDKKQSMETFVAGLEQITFQQDLGSLLDKQKRVEQLTPLITKTLGLRSKDSQDALRAASIFKADLATNMVTEMTSLQGLMGGHYAAHFGESASVANAISEQYTAVSKTPAGFALATADRIDSLVGLAAAGLLPKGSNDPFAVRRTTIHLVENLIENGSSADIHKLAIEATSVQPIEVSKSQLEEINQFVTARLESILRGRGYPYHIISAVLDECNGDPHRANQTAHAFNEAFSQPGWDKVIDAYNRCARIADSNRAEGCSQRDSQHEHSDPNAIQLHQEVSMLQRFSDGTAITLIKQLRKVEPFIVAFFDNVLIMDENLLKRQSNIALLQSIVDLTDGIVNMRLLERNKA